MTKALRFSPGIFLEIDDQRGGRRVAMVGKDGVTFWDALDTQAVTPLALHPVLNPVELGTLMGFLRAKDLLQTTLRLRDLLRTQLDARAEDSLFMMRAAWTLAAAGARDDGPVGDAALQEAIAAAAAQERIALDLHEVLGRFAGGQAA